MKIKTYALKDSTVTLKEGKYWVGDPCYIFNDNAWTELCNQMFDSKKHEDFDDRNHVRVVEVENENEKFTCYLFGTAHGDGSYPFRFNGKHKDTLGVDAGMLSVIPKKLTSIEDWGCSDDCGSVITLSKDTTGRMYVNNGNFEFSNVIQIITDY